jgi:hypothetical protein
MNIKPIIEDVNDLEGKEFLEVLENEMDDIFDMMEMVENMNTENVSGFDVGRIYWEELSYEISGNRFNQTILDFVYDEYSDGLWHIDIHSKIDRRVFL